MTDSRNQTGTVIARALLDAGAVVLRPDDPFTWASGIRSPIYCDNRLTLALPETRSRITDAFVDAIQALAFEPEVIAGVATAGIPQATLVADRLELPLVYVRAKAKTHGQENLIEGRLPREAHIVVIEDLVSTGGSSLAAARALQAAGAEVAAVLAAFTYGLPAAEEEFERAGVPLVALSNLDILLEQARSSGVLTEEQCASVKEWRDNFGEAGV